MIFSLLQKLFLTLLEINIASSAVILLMLLISLISGNRYSPRTRHFVWLAISIRMLIPINMPIDHALTLHIFMAPAANVPEVGQFVPNPSDLFIGAAAGDANAADTVVSAGNRLAGLTSLQLVTIIWVAGVIAFLLYHIGAYLYTLHRLKRWSMPIKDEAAHETLFRMKLQLGVTANIALCESAKAESPLLMGYFRPKIILPVEALSQKQLELMLCHELCHFKRRDLWYKLIMLLSTVVHWFNPLCYLMERQARADTELACDAQVLQNADNDTRKAYGMAVLLFLEHGWRCKTPLTTYFYGGKRQMKQRFKDIAGGSAKKSGYAILFTVLLAVVFAGCAISVPTKENRQTAPTPVAQLNATDTGLATPDNLAYGNSVDDDLDRVSSQVSQVSDDIDRIISQIEWSKNAYSGGVMAWPLPGYNTVTSGVGPRFGGSDNHTGIDIGGEGVNGAPIVAANDGTVARVVTEYTVGVGYGKYVILDHGGGITTLYANCSDIIVGEGNSVIKGQKIAAVGSTGFSTGPHLHFEVREDGMWKDPMPYISSPGFIWPAAGGYVSEVLGGYPGHTGMDIAITNGTGTPIYAAADGVVTKVVESNVGYGRHIVIDHDNGYSTVYAHNNKLLVEVGDTVTQGQTIAEMGRTGNATLTHLHFEVRFEGKILDPADFITVPDTDE